MNKHENPGPFRTWANRLAWVRLSVGIRGFTPLLFFGMSGVGWSCGWVGFGGLLDEGGFFKGGYICDLVFAVVSWISIDWLLGPGVVPSVLFRARLVQLRWCILWLLFA